MSSIIPNTLSLAVVGGAVGGFIATNDRLPIADGIANGAISGAAGWLVCRVVARVGYVVARSAGLGFGVSKGLAMLLAIPAAAMAVVALSERAANVQGAQPRAPLGNNRGQPAYRGNNH
ncbi:MAG: hypothetical protein LBF94_03420 [Puniceicoccales bacterium]|jgi:hypothetical protein|nr:hypothetical protein [Puniceicoccales bacterium]